MTKTHTQTQNQIKTKTKTRIRSTKIQNIKPEYFKPILKKIQNMGFNRNSTWNQILLHYNLREVHKWLFCARRYLEKWSVANLQRNFCELPFSYSPIFKILLNTHQKDFERGGGGGSFFVKLLVQTFSKFVIIC